MPSEVKISLENAFAAIISFSGEVKVIKMPDVLCPLKDENEPPKPAQGTAEPVKGAKGAPAQKEQPVP